MNQIQLRLQNQAGELLANTFCDARGAIQIEISDGAIFLPDRGSQLGIPLDQPLQLVINGAPGTPLQLNFKADQSVIDLPVEVRSDEQ